MRLTPKSEEKFPERDEVEVMASRCLPAHVTLSVCGMHVHLTPAEALRVAAALVKEAEKARGEK